ncbi:hypothetical protein DM02DRAFT_512920 [Periconia macrospinosa]|uniref:Chitin synthesis regulation, congo red resistance, RCR protein n=1 Tax=Periconia macrospinosa TaxID=97972 RepID=A0A2V1EAF8_9PLEO|nr:hypothetical protein DM02DRAFT_512920 [Periconia macrospinosa]
MARCYYRYGNRYCERSAWNSWVRWVVLAVVIFGFLALFFLCSCISARRRRKAGRQPFYGTGWVVRPGQYGAQPYYNNNQQQNWQQPPPQYTPQPQNNGYYGGGQNQGYFGTQPKYGQETGVELQQPQPTYNRGPEAEYAPPPGPPPAKNDGIVR